MKNKKELKLEDLMTVQEMELCRDYLSTKTDNEKMVFVEVFADFLFTKVQPRRRFLGKHKNAYCTLCTLLKQFVGLNPQNTPPNR